MSARKAPVEHRSIGNRPVVVVHHEAASHGAGHPVTHQQVVVSFYVAGKAVAEQRSRWHVKAGDAFLVPAGEPHTFKRSADSKMWSLALCPVCLAADGAGELLDVFDRVRRGGVPVVSIPEERRSYLARLFEELRREIDESNPSLLVQRSLVTLIIAEVSRAASWSVSDPEGDLVSEALRFIERRCLQPISTRDVAKAMRRTPAHLTTAVRRATGQSVQEWIIAGRMSEARRRLVHTDERVDVIAERVGYSDATHFIRLFRRVHGMTPNAWRLAQRALTVLPPSRVPSSARD